MTIKDHPDLTSRVLHVFSADLCQLLSKVAARLQLGPPNKAAEVHEEYVYYVRGSDSAVNTE